MIRWCTWFVNLATVPASPNSLIEEPDWCTFIKGMHIRGCRSNWGAIKLRQLDFTLIVTSYNQLEYLKVGLNSAISQTIPFSQIIIVDDCSTDGSSTFLADWKSSHSHVKIVQHATNQGAAEARNSALLQAKGDYVAFLDGDDYLVETYCERLHDLLDKGRPDVGYFDYQAIREFEGRWINVPPPFSLFNTKGLECANPRTDEARIDLMRIHYGPWCKILRRDFIEKHNLRFFGRFYEDIIWHHQTLLLSNSICCSDEKLVKYRRHKNATMETTSDEHYTYLDSYRRVARFLAASDHASDSYREEFRRMRFQSLTNFVLNTNKLKDNLMEKFAQELKGIPEFGAFTMSRSDLQDYEKIKLIWDNHGVRSDQN